MSKRLAIVQNADEPQLLSTAEMLRSAGYDTIKCCSSQLRDELKKVGCDTIIAVSQMERMGYDPLTSAIPEASLDDMDRCDLFCEIKVRNVPHILNRWPRLDKRIAYIRVNGSQPEICPKGGDEVNLPCPVITACLWYGTERYRSGKAGQQDDVQALPAEGADWQKCNLQVTRQEASEPITEARLREYGKEAHANRHDSSGMCYVMWPPYPKMSEYVNNERLERTANRGYDPAYGIAHYMPAWGFGTIVNNVADLGVHLYGERSPKGQIPHSTVKLLAQTAMAFVHLKSVDCPGWALYEAMLSGCPVITSRLLNSRMLGYELLIDGDTCLEFGVPASLEYGRGDMAFDKCLGDIKDALSILSSLGRNHEVGENGRQQLLELMWSKDKPEDVESFTQFCHRNFI